MNDELVYVVFRVGYVVPKSKVAEAREAIQSDLDSMWGKDMAEAIIETSVGPDGGPLSEMDVPSWID